MAGTRELTPLGGVRRLSNACPSMVVTRVAPLEFPEEVLLYVLQPLPTMLTNRVSEQSRDFKTNHLVSFGQKIVVLFAITVMFYIPGTSCGGEVEEISDASGEHGTAAKDGRTSDSAQAREASDRDSTVDASTSNSRRTGEAGAGSPTIIHDACPGYLSGSRVNTFPVPASIRASFLVHRDQLVLAN